MQADSECYAPGSKMQSDALLQQIAEMREKENVSSMNMGENILSCIAGENISSGRVVQITDGSAFYYDPTDNDSVGFILGITKNAALVDDLVNVQNSGVCYLPGQGFTPGRRYYAGPLGTLVETTNTLIVQPVGHSISSDKIVINFLSPIKTI
jgi:hypothetical protein